MTFKKQLKIINKLDKMRIKQKYKSEIFYLKYLVLYRLCMI